MAKTLVLKVDPLDIDPKAVRRAAAAIRGGKLVAFPTETVYGLGANAFDGDAVAGIFEAKKRPLDDPIIVHISEKKDLSRVAENVPVPARKLISEFWPGPLTLILKKTKRIPDIVTCGLDTVGVRLPSNPIARKLIGEAGVPVAAPSANLFGRPSPTVAGHVIDDLDGSVSVVLDGGKTEIGVESTVVEIVRDGVVVHRPGGVSVEDIRSVVKKVRVYTEEEAIKRSPGKYPRHYSPLAKVVIIPEGKGQAEKVLSSAERAGKKGLKVGILAVSEHASIYRRFDAKILGPSHDARHYASGLFHALREFDKEKVDIIIAEAIAEKGLGLAVMNRLRKAAG